MTHAEHTEFSRQNTREPQTIQVLSRGFMQGQPIPSRYTVDGADVSPPLRWSNPPAETRSLAIICDDPDAPSGLFVHWLAWNIAPDRRHLDEGVRAEQPGLLCQGTNGFGTRGYRGPNPPRGQQHHYAFRVYALDTRLALPEGATRDQLESAMRGHVLAVGSISGQYAH